MDITISADPLSFITFRDFVFSSSDWFTPSLRQVPNLEDWILKMHQNGVIYYSSSESRITALIVVYRNTENHFIYIPYICVHPNFQGRGMSEQIINYMIKQLPEGFHEIYLEVRKDNEFANLLYKKIGFHTSEDRGDKYLMKKEI